MCACATFLPSHWLSVSSRQVTTARSVCGTWRARHASRSSPLTVRSSRSRYTTWRSTQPSATSAAPGPTRSLRSSYDLKPPAAARRAQRTGGIRLRLRVRMRKQKTELILKDLSNIRPTPPPDPSDLGWPGSRNKHTSG